MTRHELEIEQSLYRGTKKADELKHLVKAKTQGLLFRVTKTYFFSFPSFHIPSCMSTKQTEVVSIGSGPSEIVEHQKTSKYFVDAIF